jgi:hypothetical protein
MAGTYGTLTLQQEGNVWIVIMNGGDNRVNADFLASWHTVLDIVERYAITHITHIHPFIPCNQ